jgi:site-specific DNA-cytosine methylase
MAFNERQQAGTITENCANTLSATDYKGVQCVVQPTPFRKTKRAQTKEDHETWVEDEKANTINTFDVGDVRTTQAVLQPIAVDVYNQSIDGQVSATVTEAVGGSNTSGPKVMQPIAVAGFLPTQGSKANGIGYMEEQAPTLRAGCDVYGVLQPTIIDRAAFNQGANAQYDIKIEEGETMPSLVAKGPHGVATQTYLTMAIRRLTPKECERLQGFPDDWTLIPYRGKPADQCPDGPRYKACGNSMAVPVMRWIGERIQMVEDIMKSF